jgi:hypothetical protein
METLSDSDQTKKQAFKYFCNICDYRTSKKCNFETHILTGKHTNATKRDIMLHNQAKNKPNKDDTMSKQFVCLCGKQYLCRQSLWRHNKNCLLKNNNSDTDKNHKLIEYLMKENKEMKELILEIVKNGSNNTINNTTHTNSHNKAFNLNFFLNETCKNAMNITDFVDSIKLQLSDFMNVGEAGFVQGISNIIVKKLNDLDETVRPIHCTDRKRETFYVKDENKWEKEEEDLKRIRKMINRVASKNEILMHEYKKIYPDYKEYDSRRSDQYSKFVIEALGGQGDNKKEKENKIINHISRATTIKDKNK